MVISVKNSLDSFDVHNHKSYHANSETRKKLYIYFLPKLFVFPCPLQLLNYILKPLLSKLTFFEAPL